MHSLQFDKHELLNAFPPHVRDECLRMYESARQETRGKIGKPTQADEQDDAKYAHPRDRRAEEIWEDEHAKAGWDYERQQTESDSG